MELETFFRAKEIYKELNYWKAWISHLKDTSNGIHEINIGGQVLAFGFEERCEIFEELQVRIKGKIKLLEQQLKEL